MARKHTFDQSAAFKSIVGATEEPPAQVEAQTPKAEPTAAPVEKDTPAASSSLVHKIEKAERRTVRKHVLLTPTLSKQTERKARAMGLSLNEVINQLLTHWMEE